MWLKTSLAAGLCAALFAGSPAHAVTYNFSMTFDGANIALNPGSDVPHLTTLVPSDVALIRLRAAGGSFWRVNTELVNALYPMTFYIQAGGVRNSDILTDWKLDGDVVAEQNRIDALQRNRHIGAQGWSLPQDLIFDEVFIVLTLNSSTNTTRLLADNPDVFYDFGDTLFFRDGPQNGDIEFVEGGAASPIPLPSGLPLLATGIVGLLFLRWLRGLPPPGDNKRDHDT